MKINQLIMMYIILTSLNVLAENEPTTHNTISVTPFTGYRDDVFQWSTPRGSCRTDPKLSELTWKNHIVETGIKVETPLEDRGFSFLGQMKYGIILNQSSNQDSDWDNIGEYAKSFSSVKGNVFDLSGAVGVSRQLSPSIITYYLGMDYTKYKMKDYGLNYKIHRFPYTNINNKMGHVNPKSQLVNTYNFSNYAPWIGVSIDYPVTNQLSIKPTLKAYLFYLSARANWILRDDYSYNLSFTDKAFGTGASFDTQLLYRYNNKLDIYANAGVKMLKMLQGRKKSFFHNGETYTHDLKKLSFMSSSVSGGVKYKF